MSQPNPFTKAIRRLQGRWTKSHYIGRDGHVCLWGAVLYANGLRVRHLKEMRRTDTGPAELLEMRRYLVEALPEHPQAHAYRRPGMHWQDPESFNDYSPTSEEDVLLVLKKAEYAWDEDHGAA